MLQTYCYQGTIVTCACSVVTIEVFCLCVISKYLLCVYISQVSYLWVKYPQSSCQKHFYIGYVSFVVATTKCFTCHISENQ